MGVTSANIPNFSGKSSLSLADLQALSDVVRANMLQAEQPPARVKVGVALPRPAHHVPEGGMYFGESFIAPVSSHVSRPGLVQSLEFMSGLSRPAFVQGKGFIPLAETVDAEGYFLPTPVAGALTGARWATDSSVAYPRILPGGVLEIPPTSGGSSGIAPPPLAEWDAENTSVPGLIAAVYFASEVDRPRIDFGNIRLPMAATVDSASVELATAVAGAIAGVQYATDSSVDKPRILHGGIIELPQNAASAPLANFGPGKETVPGLVANVAFSLGDPEPTANNGFVSIPLAATVDSASNKLTPAIMGAIGGARWAAGSVTEPRIAPGGIIEIPRGGALQGLQDAAGNAVTWAGVESLAGSQVKVASILLNTGSTNIPLSLYAGINNGFLSFCLVDTV